MLARVPCIILAILFAVPSLAFASPNVGDTVTVEADAHGTDNECPTGWSPVQCPATWDTSGTPTPGDDRVHSGVFVDQVRVTTRPPVGNAPLEKVTLDPSSVFIPNPLNRPLNETWPQVNNTRPDVVRPYLAFESRRERDYQDDGTFTESNWGVFLTLYLPPGHTVANHDNLPVVFYCWNACYVTGNSYMQGSEDGVRPFPNDVFARYYDGGGDLDSDVIMATKFREAEHCMNEPYAPCDTTAVGPAIEQASQSYYDVAPEFSGGFQFNKTTFIIHPDNGPMGPEPPATQNATRLDAPVWWDNATQNVSATLDGSKDAPPSSGEPQPPAPPPEKLPPPSSSGVTSLPPPPTPLPLHGLPVVLVAGAATVVLFGAVWALYHRVQKREALAQETRARLWALIQATPGLLASDIAERLSLHPTSVKYHLARMRDAGQIRLVPVGKGRQARVFPTGLREETARLGGALAQPTLHAMYAALVKHGPMTHRALAAIVNIAPSNVSRRMAELQEAGLAHQERIGRRVIITALLPLATPALADSFGVAGA